MILINPNKINNVNNKFTNQNKDINIELALKMDIFNLYE
ncbi:hypothetical protein ATK78_0449 [Pedobacter metabolipauper]|uniref:Uncharacterized protein n=1 Tax=Pedobacter metabolipauper TaxID=425513 RepID=A0A4R6T1Y7_9SPHI|nr:hypothetical protein ATK78_0449 [Pedobacter metabolipauper]